MRKFKSLFLLALLAVVLLPSCSKDDEEEIIPEEDKPVVTVFDSSSKPITTINDKDAGATVPVTVKFEWGAQKSKLVSIKIETTLQGQTFVVLDTVLNKGFFNGADEQLICPYNIAVGQTTSTIKFSATDKKGRVGTTTVTVAPKGTKIPEARRVVLLAGQLNVAASYGGFYSVSLDQVYKLEDAVTNAPYIDMVYYYGNTNEATLATMSDELLYDAKKGPAGIRDVMFQFKVRNATKFASITAAQFDGATMPDATLEAKSMTQLAVGDCLAFETALKDKGVIKVVDIKGTDPKTRAIELDVKVIK